MIFKKLPENQVENDALASAYESRKCKGRLKWWVLRIVGILALVPCCFSLDLDVVGPTMISATTSVWILGVYFTWFVMLTSAILGVAGIFLIRFASRKLYPIELPARNMTFWFVACLCTSVITLLPFFGADIPSLCFLAFVIGWLGSIVLLVISKKFLWRNCLLAMLAITISPSAAFIPALKSLASEVKEQAFGVVITEIASSLTIEQFDLAVRSPDSLQNIQVGEKALLVLYVGARTQGNNADLHYNIICEKYLPRQWIAHKPQNVKIIIVIGPLIRANRVLPSGKPLLVSFLVYEWPSKQLLGSGKIEMEEFAPWQVENYWRQVAKGIDNALKEWSVSSDKETTK